LLLPPSHPLSCIARCIATLLGECVWGFCSGELAKCLFRVQEFSVLIPRKQGLASCILHFKQLRPLLPPSTQNTTTFLGQTKKMQEDKAVSTCTSQIRSSLCSASSYSGFDEAKKWTNHDLTLTVFWLVGTSFQKFNQKNSLGFWVSSLTWQYVRKVA